MVLSSFSTLYFVIFILRISMLSLCHTQSLFWLPWCWTLRSHQPVTVFIRWDSYNLVINSLWPNFTIWWHRSGSTMGPVYSLLLVGTNPLPEPVVTSHRCVLWHLHDRNFPGNTHGINLLDKFENYILQITADSQALVCILVFVVLFSGSPTIKAS